MSATSVAVPPRPTHPLPRPGRIPAAESRANERTLRRDPLMPYRCGLVERAFQLAASGGFERLRDIAAHLNREGYYEVEDHFGCPLLRRQLRAEMDKAGAPNPRSRTAAEPA